MTTCLNQHICIGISPYKQVSKKAKKCFFLDLFPYNEIFVPFSNATQTLATMPKGLYTYDITLNRGTEGKKNYDSV